MFEYVSPKKADKEQVRNRVITVILTLIGAVVIFGLLYWAASSGI
jgi:hypothetical protein